ncbi:MAG: NYN domain-containing protein [Chloroflexi bacterium]|nr:NYN domain-containing protein [Chloroflexota bacterium]
MPKATARPSSRTDERVMVFIDGSNLYHVLGQTCGRHDLQFDKFAQKLAGDRDLRRVYYYNIRQEAFEGGSNVSEQDRFLSSLYDTPYLEVKLGIWKQRGGTMVEKGVDVMLAVDLVTRAYRDHYDTAIIVSGDADFFPALQAAKDVGKHVEVAAFDTNISSEAARVADVHIKLTKTFFTGLWMTRTQQKQRAVAARRPEVSDEAASPNGEDKAATKAATKSSTSRRPVRGGRRAASHSTSTDSRSTSNAPESKPETAPVATSAPSTREPEAPAESSRPNIRRTPSRRKVGGTAASAAPAGTNGNGINKPRPPALRIPASTSASGNGGETAPAAAEPAPAPAATPASDSSDA